MKISDMNKVERLQVLGNRLMNDLINSNSDKEYIDETELTLDMWLTLLNSSYNKRYLFIDYMFPNDNIKDQYLKDINTRSNYEVKKLIKKFLIPSCSLGTDNFSLYYILYLSENDKEKFKEHMGFEYYRRLVKNIKDKAVSPWEGITWTLDLLPHFPKHALDAIDAYLLAHAQFLPDGRLMGLQDAMTLIRAKYLEITHPRSLLLSLDPYKFESLIASLYAKNGYKTTMTQKTHDGGIDIKATKDIEYNEKILIQCKRMKKTVGVSTIRDLFGSVSNDNATKGVVVSTSNFSRDAKKFAKNTARLELIDNERLQKLLNETFGPNWPYKIDSIIANKKY